MTSCLICRRPIDAHTLDEARACLEVRALMEEHYCRLTGPKKVAA